MSVKQQSLHGFVLLACVAMVVALTTLPASIGFVRVVYGITLIEGHRNANDAIGHAVLYGTLMAVTYWALRRRVGFARAFWIALVTGMLLGGLTEVVQQFSPGRSMLLSDLLANWFGTMSVAMLLGYSRTRDR